MPERARAGEQVEHARVVHAVAEDREQRLAHPVGGRAGVRAGRGLQAAPSVCPGDHAHRCVSMSRPWTCAALCLGFAGAEETYPFSARDDRLQGAREDLRDRARSTREPPLRSASSASRSSAAQLRADHAAITPGYHLNKRHWNTVTVDGSAARRGWSATWSRTPTTSSWSALPKRRPRRSRAGHDHRPRHRRHRRPRPRRRRATWPRAGSTCSCTAATRSARRRSRRRSARPACTWPTSRRWPQVRALADALPRLDVLVNNAGLISEERRGDRRRDRADLPGQPPGAVPAHHAAARARRRRGASCTSPRPARSARTSTT